MRVLDCKRTECEPVLRAAPAVGDLVSEPSREHFAAVCSALGALGVSYEVAPRLVRGFDYYTHSVFETSLPGLGAQDAVLGGGRYDDLVEDLGGPPTPAVGASLGIERLVLALGSLESSPDVAARPDLAICLLDEAGRETAAVLAARCRAAGLRVRIDYEARSPKAGLRDANRVRARYAGLIGREELAKRVIQLKDLTDGRQTPVELERVPGILRRAAKPAH
jgi:histidyl-tRNA synthetase